MHCFLKSVMILDSLHNFSRVGRKKLKELNDQEKKPQTFIFEASHSIPKDMVIDCRVAKEGNAHSIEFHMIIGGRPFLSKSYVQGEEVSDDEIGEVLGKFLREVIKDILERYGFEFTMREVQTYDKIVQLNPL